MFVAIGERFGIITWHDVYKSVGITEPTDVFENYDMSAHFIDVGKADSIYVNCKDKNILIDGGEKDMPLTVFSNGVTYTLYMPINY